MTNNKQIFKSYLDRFAHPDAIGQSQAIADFYAADAIVNVVHPFNKMANRESFERRFMGSLGHSFSNLYRRDYLLTSGSFDGQEWVSSTGYYVGYFARDWLGIKATEALAYLRVGEFHRMEGGRAVESYVYLDIPQLMISANQWPIADSPGLHRGYTGYLPGPASQDGLSMARHDPAESKKSFQLTTDMLSKLATKDEAWRPYWHENMLWYGPAAFGSFVGIEHFADFQVTFENAFDGWAGGSSAAGRTRHFVRHGDGNYSCSGGWPSLSGVQIKTFMGQPATHKMLYMRVCDWWRREGDLFVENWVFVDIPDVLLQMGVDLFEGVEIPG